MFYHCLLVIQHIFSNEFPENPLLHFIIFITFILHHIPYEKTVSISSISSLQLVNTFITLANKISSGVRRKTFFQFVGCYKSMIDDTKGLFQCYIMEATVDATQNSTHSHTKVQYLQYVTKKVNGSFAKALQRFITSHWSFLKAHKSFKSSHQPKLTISFLGNSFWYPALNHWQ